jgi:hypothetical protein
MKLGYSSPLCTSVAFLPGRISAIFLQLQLRMSFAVYLQTLAQRAQSCS